MTTAKECRWKYDTLGILSSDFTIIAFCLQLLFPTWSFDRALHLNVFRRTRYWQDDMNQLMSNETQAHSLPLISARASNFSCCELPYPRVWRYHTSGLSVTNYSVPCLSVTSFSIPRLVVSRLCVLTSAASLISMRYARKKKQHGE